MSSVTFVTRKGEIDCGENGEYVQFMISSVIVRDPDILGGMPVFEGTRVLAPTFLDCLEAGYSIDDFMEDFPSVRREQAVKVLEEAGERLELAAH